MKTLVKPPTPFGGQLVKLKTIKLQAPESWQ